MRKWWFVEICLFFIFFRLSAGATSPPVSGRGNISMSNSVGSWHKFANIHTKRPQLNDTNALARKQTLRTHTRAHTRTHTCKRSRRYDNHTDIQTYTRTRARADSCLDTHGANNSCLPFEIFNVFFFTQETYRAQRVLLIPLAAAAVAATAQRNPVKLRR